MMNWILDLAVLAVLLIGALIGYRRGAVRTLLEFVGFFVAALVAVWFSGIVAEPLFRGMFREKLVETVGAVLSENIGEAVSVQAEKLMEMLPDYLANAVGLEKLTEMLQSAVSGNAGKIAESIVDQAIAPVAVLLIRVLIGVITFILCKVVLRWIVKVCDLIAKLPVLKQLNGLLGLGIGLLKSAMILLVALTVIRSVVPMLQDPGIFSEETVKESVLFELVYEKNPLYHAMTANDVEVSKEI